jgi:hypothetical protein
MSQDLRLERVYDAAPEVVFDAFTDPEAQKDAATMRMSDGTSFDTEVEVRFEEEAPGRVVAARSGGR